MGVLRNRYRPLSLLPANPKFVQQVVSRMCPACDRNVSRSFSKSLQVTLVLIALIVLVRSGSALAQETSSDWAWTPIMKVEGVDFLYIFYREADTENNGVVLKLVNWNDYPIHYRFLVVFKSGKDEYEELVTGRIEAKTFVTGDELGLFFIPFKDGRSIGEIGLKAYRITKRAKSNKASSAD